MKSNNDIQPIINRTHNSEATSPEIAIAATPSGMESVYLGPLQDSDGKVAHLRVARSGYRVLFQNEIELWNAAPNHSNVHGVAMGTANVGTISQLKITLKALEFKLSEQSEAFMDQLPGSAGTAYTAVRSQRSIVPAVYLPKEVQALREYSAGASLFRGY